MVYALHESERDAMRASVATRALALEGIDLVMWLERDAHDAPREGVISSLAHGELRFCPGGPLEDPRGVAWSVEGALAAIEATVQDGRLLTSAYPDALARVWAALTCPTSGEVLLSAAPGYEFIDWGRQAHVGGGSHGSLHASDSLGALVLCGVGLPEGSPTSGRSATSPRSSLAISGSPPAKGKIRGLVTLAVMRRLSALIACAATCATPAVASAASGAIPSGLSPSPLAAAGTDTVAGAASSGQSTSSQTPIPVPPSNIPPAGHRLSANRVLAIASALGKMRAVRAKYPGSYGGAYLKIPFHWQVSYFSRNGKKEIGQVIIDDFSGRVLEQWTGFQVAWTMARGYPGAFGRHVNALYIWLPLCVLFILPFFDFRRPFSLLHLDLLVLLSFSVSLAFFNHARIYASVPLVYPPLIYLLARMLALMRRGSAPKALHLLVPAPWLALGVVFLIGFRIGLNVTDSNVIDVGYAGVIGAQRIVHGGALYGSYPSDNEHGDTYGPVNYEAYVPFEQIFGWSGTWDDLPAAHAAAIVFDLLAVALLFLLGRRVRGPTLGSPSPTPGSPTRSRCSRWRATPTTPSSPCSCSRRCLPPPTNRRSASPPEARSPRWRA